MKKIFLFAAAAALLTACSNEELASVETAQQNADGASINFSVYTPRALTRAGVPGIVTDATLKDNTTDLGKAGFGILAYYTDDEKYDKESSQPDFMYNTQVKYDGSKWAYNPVMYWPNEFGATAKSENTDYVSFFAYSPYIDVTNETGIPVYEAITDYDKYAKSLGIKYSESTTTNVTDRKTFAQYLGKTDFADDASYIAAAVAESGDPSITTTSAADTWVAGCALTYNIATLKSVDDLASYKTYIGTTDDDVAKAELDELWKEQVQGKNITELPKNTAGGDPIVKYIVDTNPATSVDLLWGVAANNTDYTPIAGADPVIVGKAFVDLVKPKNSATDKLTWNLKHALSKLAVNIKYIADNKTTPEGTSEIINENTTRIYVRYIKIGGFVMKGALNLNNTTVGEPLWKNYDGLTSLAYTTTTFNDGRKDGKEGIYNGIDKNEENVGLNPDIVENYSNGVWPTGKTPGVISDYVNLFGAEKDAPIFVIPTNEDIDIEICYDVETQDPNLAGFLSDGLTHGSTIQNIIRKDSKTIFGTTSPVIMEPGKGYNINIILGMTSVKFEAVVVPWDTTAGNQDVTLPDNK